MTDSTDSDVKLVCDALGVKPRTLPDMWDEKGKLIPRHVAYPRGARLEYLLKAALRERGLGLHVHSDWNAVECKWVYTCEIWRDHLTMIGNGVADAELAALVAAIKAAFCKKEGE